MDLDDVKWTELVHDCLKLQHKLGVNFWIHYQIGSSYNHWKQTNTNAQLEELQLENVTSPNRLTSMECNVFLTNGADLKHVS